jgi:hypothetical protein
MTDLHSSHATYDELASPEEMHADCDAARTNMPDLRKLAAVKVPAQAAYVGGAVRRTATRPAIAVSDAAARLGRALNPFD